MVPFNIKASSSNVTELMWSIITGWTRAFGLFFESFVPEKPLRRTGVETPSSVLGFAQHFQMIFVGLNIVSVKSIELDGTSLPNLLLLHQNLFN